MASNLDTEPNRPEDLSALVYDTPETRAAARPIVRVLMCALAYEGYVGAIPAIASPWIAKTFRLDQSGIAVVFACLTLSSFGALALSRMIDRIGRRRVLLWSMAAMPTFALCAAASRHLVMFVVFTVLDESFAAAAAAASIVMLAEALPIARRAAGQSYGGMAASGGAGICVFLIPLLIGRGLSWRWIFVLVATGIVLVPWMRSAIPESARWELAAREGEATRTHFYDVFIPLYRRRSVTMLTCTLLGSIVGEGINSWGYFHMVSVVKMSAGQASALMIVGGGLALVGFPIGAWFAERAGRIWTVVGFGILTGAGGTLFYWAPAHSGHPMLWLGLPFMLMNIASNAVTVGSNAAATELFPTALRGTMIGWFALLSAIGALSTETSISILARRFGGSSIVIGWLATIALPSSLLFGTLDETRGLSLDEAADEAAFRETRRKRRKLFD